MELLLRAHIDDKPRTYRPSKDKRPHYTTYLSSGRVEIHKLDVRTYTEDIPKRIYYECYKGSLLMIDKGAYVWWKPRLKERAMLVAWDLPKEIRDLSKDIVESRSGGFTFTWFVNDNGMANGYLPKIEVQYFGGGYSFRWQMPWKKNEHKHCPGRFLNLSQLVMAMRNEEMSYETALKEWGVSDLPTLTTAVLAEFDAMDLPIAVDKVYSSAGLAKAALAAAGVKRPRIRSTARLGQAMVAYHGPRIETPIVRKEVPVTYVDFKSLYPAVTELLGNWQILTAGKLRVRPYTRRARELLRDLERDDLFNPEVWRDLGAFCAILPDDNLLPVRTDSGSDLRPLRCSQPLWYGLPDLIACKLLTGKVPHILEAWRLEPEGGNDDNLFVSFINRRATEPKLSHTLKVLANSGAYGIFAELNKCKERDVTLHGLSSFRHKCSEKPGNFYFPPLAAITTSGARLTLALLQAHVPSFVFCDTDSMAIDNRVLSWNQVEAIRKKFQALSPFSNGDFLKLEDENFVDGARTQLYAYATAPKEYCLYSDGDVVRKRTELGLVYDPPSENWIDEVWKCRLAIERNPMDTLKYLPVWESQQARDSFKIRSAHSWKLYGTKPFDTHSLDLNHTMRKVIQRGLGNAAIQDQSTIEAEKIRYCGKEIHTVDLRHFDMNRVEFYSDRKCLCGCGEDLGDDPRRKYVNETHRKRVQRRRLAA